MLSAVQQSALSRSQLDLHCDRLEGSTPCEGFCREEVRILYVECFQMFFHQNTTIANTESISPLVINDTVVGETALLLAAVSGKGISPVLRPLTLSPQADFIPR